MAGAAFLLVACILWGVLVAILTGHLGALDADTSRVAATVPGLVATTLAVAGGLLLLLPARHEFDRTAGLYRRRTPVGGSERPLSEVVAVQLAQGHGVAISDESGREVGRHPSYELNVVLARNGRVDRRMIAGTTNLRWADVTGRELAAFLLVPYLRHIPA
jgi:hypothetical protein